MEGGCIVKRELFLGFDLGTSDIKGTITDINMNVLYENGSQVPLSSPTRLNLNVLYDAFISTAKSLQKQAGDDFKNIIGIGVVGQGDGLWPLDEEKQPFTDVYMWNDLSSKEIGLEKIEEFSRLAVSLGCSQMGAGHFPIIAHWLKHYRPDEWNRMRWQIHVNDWINYKLTGVLCTDHVMAESTGFNFRKKRFSTELFEAMEIPEALDRLLPVKDATEIIGFTTERACMETGIPAGIPVICGTMDGMGVGIGSGLYREHEALIGAGTTICMTNIFPTSELDLKQYYATGNIHGNSESNCCFSATLNGAQTIRWITDTFAPGKNYEEIDTIIRNIAPGCKGLLFQPYIFGERSPFVNPFATGAFLGLDYMHTPDFMLRAGYEGVAMAVRDCFESMGKADSVKISGGLSNSAVFCQMIADVIGLPLQKTLVHQAGTFGAIKLLQIALGYKKELNEFDDVNCILYEPDQKVHEFYEEWFHEFQAVKETMKPFWTFRGNHL